MMASPKRIGLSRAERGVTLVELIAFIVIAAIVAVAMVQAFSVTMRGSHLGKEMTHATQLAQERMEVILGQRKRLGYPAFVAGDYDPCQAPPVVAPPWSATQFCAVSTGYVVSSTAPVADSCGAGCSEITVTVTGPQGDLLTSLTEQVWSY